MRGYYIDLTLLLIILICSSACTVPLYNRVRLFQPIQIQSFRPYAAYRDEICLSNARGQVLYYRTNMQGALREYTPGVSFILMDYTEGYLQQIRYLGQNGKLSAPVLNSYPQITIELPPATVLDQYFEILDAYDGNTLSLTDTLQVLALDDRDKILTNFRITLQKYWGWHNRLNIRP